MNQLFQISGPTWQALEKDEVFATAEGMKQVGICNLPYPRVDLRLPLDICSHTRANDHNLTKQEVIKKFLKVGYLIADPGPDQPDKLKFNFGPGAWLDVKNLSLDDLNYSTSIYIDPSNRNFSRCSMETRPKEYNTEYERNIYAYGLIVLLNTRNAVKTTKHRKSVALGIGKPGAYEYTTTITLPRIIEEDDAEHAPTGTARKPHLRRGHTRHQRFGPGLQFSKLVWIEPIFVNADPAWVDKRKAYNVSV